MPVHLLARIGFALQPARGPVRAVDLQHLYPCAAQDPGDSRPVGGCSLDTHGQYYRPFLRRT